MSGSGLVRIESGYAGIELRRYPPRLIGQTALAAVGYFVPIAGVMVGLARDPYRLAFAATLVCVAVAAGAFLTIRALRCRLTLTGEGVTEHALLAPDRFVPAGSIAQVDIVQVYDTTLRPQPHVFLLDRNDRALVRMTGWDDTSIDRVVRSLDVPVRHTEEPMTATELRRGRAAQLPWFERHPTWGRIVLVLGGGVFAVLQVQLVAATIS